LALAYTLSFWYSTAENASARTLGRVSKPAARFETADHDDDGGLILCRYSAAESTGVLGTVGTGSEYIPV
jgi:hypothetical protein